MNVFGKYMDRCLWTWIRWGFVCFFVCFREHYHACPIHATTIISSSLLLQCNAMTLIGPRSSSFNNRNHVRGPGRLGGKVVPLCVWKRTVELFVVFQSIVPSLSHLLLCQNENIVLVYRNSMMWLEVDAQSMHSHCCARVWAHDSHPHSLPKHATMTTTGARYFFLHVWKMSLHLKTGGKRMVLCVQHWTCPWC